jgi:putative ABC transport system permease protein
VIVILRRWSSSAGDAVYANVCMLLQLLIIGYALTFIFESDDPSVALSVIAVMLLAAAWIALRPVGRQSPWRYFLALLAISVGGVTTLLLITQLVLTLDRWYEPRFFIPLGGMIFSNAMNTISLAAERFESEWKLEPDYPRAQRVALDAALIPQINSLFAVGLVALPGMMTGQILSGVDPLIAVRYHWHLQGGVVEWVLHVQ